jgi:hypothetical protein
MNVKPAAGIVARIPQAANNRFFNAFFAPDSLDVARSKARHQK